MSGAREGSRIVLDLEPTADGIRGQVATEDGSSTPFSGWLELSALLERVRPRTGGRAEPPRLVSRDR